MKRLHVHITVENIANSVNFYSSMFGQNPTVLKEDYAKWMVEDPHVNFAISTHGEMPGVDHLGVQVENDNELSEVTNRLESAREDILRQEGATCCYAKSDKAWVLDPQGIAWETFKTVGSSAVYGEGVEQSLKNSSCCAPSM